MKQKRCILLDNSGKQSRTGSFTAVWPGTSSHIHAGAQHDHYNLTRSCQRCLLLLLPPPPQPPLWVLSLLLICNCSFLCDNYWSQIFVSGELALCAQILFRQSNCITFCYQWSNPWHGSDWLFESRVDWVLEKRCSKSKECALNFIWIGTELSVTWIIYRCSLWHVTFLHS